MISPTRALIYNDTHRPSFWKHPIKWWRWKPDIIAWLDLGRPFDVETGDLTVTFGEPEDS